MANVIGLVASSIFEKAKAAVLPTVSAEKLASWLSKEKSIDDVFTRLQLTSAGDKLFDKPQFFSWLNYADDLTSKTGKEVSTIATLTAHYGDEVLAKLVGAAKQVKSTEGAATRLQASQAHSWLDAGKSADDVFTLLKLDKAGDDILASPVFDTWNTYLKVFNKKNSNSQTSLLATLTTHYGDDAIAQIIQTAKKVGATRSEAVALETAQVQRWVTSEKSPDDVFLLLKLDKAGDDVLSSAQFASWSSMIEAALKVKASSRFAKQLEAEQFQRWMASKKSTHDALLLLKLDKSDNILIDPQLDVLTKYIKAVNKENPDKPTSLVATFTAHYGDEGLAKMLDAAKKAEATKSIATNLEAAQIQHWLSNKEKPDQVFTLLNLDKAGDDLLASPLFTIFTKFTDAYHGYLPTG
ncbi:unnamed protein product [Phytophthora fragariaefolia]|uniref:Unnamed protein product n=1 Tax=Phytophthora fragariaefolia TaxID=1490495 RepID=A0A9W7D4T6_9STRA|nr:unnamed protein product [Phytophthora fragariaefolia]